MDDILSQLAASLIEASAKDTASYVSNKIKASKARKDDKDTIRELEEIINNLLLDKMEIQRIAQAYEQELISQKITEKDIEYITNHIFPILSRFIPTDRIDDFEKIKSLLSVETLTIMQLLGFNYKKAIGEPLTLLLQKTIEARIPADQTINTKWALTMANISLDKEATERFYELTGKK